MTAIAKIILLLSAALPLLGVTGCTTAPTDTSANSYQWIPDTPKPAAGPKRFQDPALEGRTAVESAIELSEKYARLSDETLALRGDNQQLKAENDSLKQQVTDLEAKLAQAQKELTEANDLLAEMVSELNAWKSNVLGFRGEMRAASKAQLEALLKVLEILGGEVEAGTLKKDNAAILEPNTPAIPEPIQTAAAKENADGPN